MKRYLLAALLAASPLLAQEPGPQVLGAQATFIQQWLRPFTSPYDGANSLSGQGDAQLSDTYGVYGGTGLWKGGELYLDVEMARGHGVSGTVGLGGLTNGDSIREGSGDLGSGPYIARLFLRQTFGFGGGTESLPRGMDQLPVTVDRVRLVVTAGKFAANDLFDTNLTANNARTQFMDWALFNNAAWDFAADTRGYSKGVAIAWHTPIWEITAGSLQMPTQANGNHLDPELSMARGDNLQVAFTPEGTGFTGKVLLYENHARMGNYAEALARAGAGVPDITLTRVPGRTKKGLALNFEQQLAEGWSVFFRSGWSDGRQESFAFAEVDMATSIGFAAPGFGKDDAWGIALAQDRLSASHAAYLAAGGLGFVLGDGRLSYGPERIVEAYYRWQPRPWLALPPDVQRIQNPGYNRDRGPATVAGLRLRLSY
ncbi:MAG: carbohydrate porin [Acidobacteria bacterium]|nr:carbohydrate porin [Acidobacteriota bacterium]